MNMDTGKAQQRGVASIEFAFVFIIIFAIFYGMIGYFIPLLLSASYQELSSEALRQAISLKYSSLSVEEIQDEAERVIDESWLPAAWANTCEDDDGEKDYSGKYLKIAGDTWSTCVSHNNLSEILPTSLFGINLPEKIRGEATVRLY